MQTLLRIKTYVAILPIMLLMLLYSLPAYSIEPYITWDPSSGSMEQEICSGINIEPIRFNFGGDNVTQIRIDDTRIKRIPDKNQSTYTAYGWGSAESRLLVNSGSNSGDISSTIQDLSYITYKKTGSVTYEIPIQTVGGSTTAETIIKIRVHPKLNEHQIKGVNTNCTPPYNASVTVVPGFHPGTPPYFGKTSDETTWKPQNDTMMYVGPDINGDINKYVGAYSFYLEDWDDYNTVTKPGWELQLMDANGCESQDHFTVTFSTSDMNTPTINYAGEFFSYSETDCKATITVNNSQLWRFTPQDPGNLGANFPIVYVLKKKNDNGDFVEVDRQKGTTPNTTFTYPITSSGIYSVSVAFYGDLDDKLWSNCNYDVPYGSTSGPLEKDVIISGAPQIFELTAPDGNTYCDEDSDSGADLQLSGSETDTSYQLYKDGTPIGSPIQGTGSSINFGKQTEGLYTVIATKSGCTADMTGEITITKKDAPAAPVINIPNGGLSYCKGTDGAEVIVTNAVNGVTYTLYNVEESSETQVVQITATADGSLSLGMHTKGSYKVVATNDSQCSSERAEGNFSITELPLPETPIIGNINGNELCYCANNTDGAEVIVTNAVNGVTYTLYNVEGSSETQVVQITATTDGSLSLGKQTAGTYKVVATNDSQCSSERAEGNFSITELPMPEAPEIDGISADNTIGYCTDDTNGADITISNPINNITYTLYQKNGDNFTEVENSAIKYDGTNSVKWSVTEGEYKVIATNASECSSANAEGTIVIKAIQLPEKPGLTATYAACQNETGTKDLNELIHDKPDGFTVIWYDSNMNPLSNTNISLKDAGTQTFYATYTNTSGCESEKAQIDIIIGASSAVPVINNYNKCASEGTLDLNSLVELNNNDLHWFDSEMNPLDDTQTSIKKDEVGTSIYYVYNVDAGGCKSEQTEVNVTIRPLPVAPVINIPDEGLSYCTDNTDGVEVIVSNAVNGVTYTLYKIESGSDTQVAQVTATANGSLSLGMHTKGTYKVVATNDSQCSSERAEGNFSITELPLPAEIELSAPNGSGYCEGDAGVELQFPTSEEGIEYALEKDGAIIGTFTGTGSAIELGVYEAGKYIVTATNPVTGCNIQSQSAFNVELIGKSAAPTANTDYVKDGTFEICAGESQSVTLTTLIENGESLNLTWYKDAQLTEIVPNVEMDVDLSTEKDVSYYVTNTETDKCPSAAVPVRILVKVSASVPSIDIVDADGFAYNDCKKDGRFDLNDLVSSSQSNLAWFDSNMQPITDETIDMSAPGSTSYFVSAVSDDGCQSATVEVKVNIKDIATTADITADDMEVCTGASATLTATTSLVDNDLVFTWYDDADLLNVVGTGATLQISGPEDSKTYYVTVKGANTCENEAGNAAEVDVSGIRPISGVTLDPAEESIGMGEETNKTLNVEPYGANYTSAWMANGNPIENPNDYFPAKPYTDQLYKVVVTDECGNTIEATAVTKVIWPTIFTPHNNDGYNDGFLVGMQEDIHLEIYDRWGNVVYRGNDGWHQSEAAQNMPGVYYYIATLPDGSIKKGTVEVYK